MQYKNLQVMLKLEIFSNFKYATPPPQFFWGVRDCPLTMILPLLELDSHCLLPHWPVELLSGLSINSLYNIAIKAIGEANRSKMALKS